MAFRSSSTPFSGAGFIGMTRNNRNRPIHTRLQTAGPYEGDVLVVIVERVDASPCTAMQAKYAYYNPTTDGWDSAWLTVAGTAPSGLNNVSRDAYDTCMDANGVIHIAMRDNNSGVGGVKYATITTQVDDSIAVPTWTAVEVASSTVPEATNTLRINVAADAAGVPHIVWAGLESASTDDRIWYTNKIGGTWAAEVAVSADEISNTPCLLRYAGGLLGLFYVDDAGSQLYLRTRGTAAADSWSSRFDITAASAEDGNGTVDAREGGIGGANTWSVTESDDSWHVMGTDYTNEVHYYTYVEIPAKAQLSLYNIQRGAVTTNDWDHFEDSKIRGGGNFWPPALAVSTTGETISAVVPFFLALLSQHVLIQRSMYGRDAGFEPGPGYSTLRIDGMLAVCAAPRITANRVFVAVNNDDLQHLVVVLDPVRPDTAGLTHDVTLDGTGFMLAGPMTKVDITASIPRISIAAEQKRHHDFSELDTFGQITFHQGRGERYLQNPQAFSDSDDVLTHIPNQATLALKSYQAAKTGGADTNFNGNVVKFLVHAGNWYALVKGTAAANNALYVWDNANTEFDTVAAGLDTSVGDPKDMVAYGEDLWIAQGEAVNMRFYNLNVATWSDGQQPARALAVWDGKLWRADNLNEVYWSNNPDAGTPTWTLAGTVKDADSFINRMVVYQDALFVFKEDVVAVVERAGAANTYTIREISDEDSFRDVDSGTSTENGAGAFTDKGLLFYNRRDQVMRFDGASLTPIGPERGADVQGSNFIGLPSDERGEFRAFTSDGEFLYGAITPSHNGSAKPQIMVYNGVGWHSFWKGSSAASAISAVDFLPIRTTTGVLAYPTLWFGDGTSIRYIKLPRNSYNPLDDSTLEFVTSGFLEFAHFDAGLPEVEKVIGDVLLEQALQSGFTGNIGLSIKLNELDSSVITGHTQDGTWWQLLAAASFNSNAIPVYVSEPVNGDHLAHGGIVGGAVTAKRIAARIKLTGAGTAGATPTLRSYSYRFVTKPNERFGWTIPLKVYTDMERLDARDEPKTPDQLRAVLYSARASKAPVVFVDGAAGSRTYTNELTDPVFRVGGLTATVGTVAENTFCSLHKRFGERSQFVRITSTADAGVASADITIVDAATRISASAWLLIEGDRSVTVQLRTGSTVLTEKTVYPNPEWQRVDVSLDRILTANGSSITLNLAVVAKAAAPAATIHISGAQIVFGTADPLPFIEGSQPGCYWTAKPNASTSVRRVGHRVYVTGISEVFRYRKTPAKAAPVLDSEITVQLREVL